MKTFKGLSWLLLPIFLMGCKNGAEDRIDAFGTVVELKVSDCLFDDADYPLGTIEDIQIWNNCILLQHTDLPGSFTMLDSCGRVMTTFCHLGHGHNECLSVEPRFTVKKSVLSFYDRHAKNLCSINLDDVCKNPDSMKTVKRPVPYTLDFRPSYAAALMDGMVCRGSFAGERFGCLDGENKRIHHGIDYPFATGGLTDLEKGSVFQGFMIVCPSMDRFAIVTYASDVFELFRMTDSVPQRCFVSPCKKVPSVVESGGRKTTDTSRCCAGFINGCATDSSVYLLYVDENYDEWARNGYKSFDILSFGWDGRKKVKYHLPESVQCFTVSSDYLYVVSQTEGLNRLYRFRLP